MSNTDDPDDRDIRRRQLAKRLVFHHARTQTVTEFTGLSRNQLETLRGRWNVPTNARHRGPSPTSFTEFFRNAKAVQEATAAAVLFDLLDVRNGSRTADSRGSTRLEQGERLCYVFEALQACFPHLELEFEHMMLLASGLSRGEALRLGSCAQCGSALLVDNFAARMPSCKHCSRESPIFDMRGT